MSEEHIECPIAPVPNEIPEGEMVYSVPMEFRSTLREIILRRREYNNMGTWSPNGSYYHAASRNEARYCEVMEQIRRHSGALDQVIFELHSGWRYTATTLEMERLKHEAKLAKKGPEEKASGGPTDEYMKRWPDGPTPLWRLMFAQDAGSAKIAYRDAIRGAGTGTLAKLAARLDARSQ